MNGLATSSRSIHPLLVLNRASALKTHTWLASRCSISTGKDPRKFPALHSRALDGIEQKLRPYDYTSGGWLHQDQLQREARRVDFDFGQLCVKARAVFPGLSDIVSVSKAEGGFNRCFIFESENSKVVARIPTKLAGPARLTTRSEVATMQLVSRLTDVPVPKVLDWSDDPEGPVGAEYIIMEYIDAVRLGEVWDDMDAVQRIKCTEKLSRHFVKVANLQFPGYGSLTYKNDSTNSIRYDAVCSVGPHCGSRYWKCGLGEAELFGTKLADCGPWTDLPAYISALYDTAIARLPLVTPPNTPAWKGCREEILSLLKQCHAVMQAMIWHPKIQEASAPVLYHPDFDMKNIFVSRTDPTKIVSIIDWQSASIEPAFMLGSNNPDFASLPERTPLDVGASDELKVELERELQSASFCAQAHDAILRLLSPRHRLARELPEDIALIFKLSPIAWTVGAVSIRAELLRLNREWSSLGFEGQCPYVPTAEELESHDKLFEDFETAQMLKKMVMQMLGCGADGSVLSDRWEQAREQLPEVIDWWDSACEDAEGVAEEEARRLFPFDGK